MFSHVYHRGSAAYLYPYSSGASTLVVTINRLYLAPFFVLADRTYTVLGLHISGAAAGNCRMGIYNVAADGGPGTLLLDAGTISTGTTGSPITLAISQGLTKGPWWIAAVYDAAPTIRAVNSGEGNHLGAYLSGTTLDPVMGVYRAFTYAALPADETGQTHTPITTTSCPIPGIR